MIALTELNDDADVEAQADKLRQMIRLDPNILHGEIGIGLKLMKDYVPHASLSLMLDFEDEAAWRRYVDGEPHREVDSDGMAVATRVTATQYIIESRNVFEKS